jgi:nucleoside-diphosphate-sugar epimerase
MGTVNILEMASLFSIRKVLHTSTGSVDGKASGFVKEDTQISPSDLYGATKTVCEYIGIQYARTFGLDFRIARLFAVYGPGELVHRCQALDISRTKEVLGFFPRYTIEEGIVSY